MQALCDFLVHLEERPALRCVVQATSNSRRCYHWCHLYERDSLPWKVFLLLSQYFPTILLNFFLHISSLVGAFVLVVGFYAVIWGKSKEEKINNDTESSNYQALLLHQNTDEV